MGKNKDKVAGKKIKKEKAFVVNTMKKSKTKPIASNLKKLNFQSKAKTSKADASFKELQTELTAAAKKSSQTPKQTSKGKNAKAKEPKVVDMDVTTESFSKL